MASEFPDLVTPIELVTSVEGSDIRVRLAGRVVNRGMGVEGIHDLPAMQARLHNQALDALAEAVKHALAPELWKFRRQQEKRHRQPQS
ncbi:hypothetical protein ACIA8B_22785 [Micromonospora chalcea]